MKLYLNKDSRHVRPVTDSQAVQAQTCTKRDRKQTVSSAWGTLHCLRCAGLRCDKLQVLCVLCTEVFCVNHHAKEMFITTSWHLLLRVCVCGEMTFQFQRRNFTPLLKKCCELYFGGKVGDPDKSWAPHISCITCVRLLTGCVNGSHQMPFAVPMFGGNQKTIHPIATFV